MTTFNLRDRKCTKTDCSKCITCVYDEGNIEDEMKEEEKKLIPFSYAYCNECPNAVQQEISTTYKTFKYLNWFCNKAVSPYSVATGTTTQRNIEMSQLDGKKITTPFWCPLKKAAQSANAAKPITSPARVSTIAERQVANVLTYKEKYDLWSSITPLMLWADIKEGEVYHIPPVMSEKRKDILIISKSNYSVTYRNLSDNKSITESFYPTSSMAKFLVKHKIKDIKVIKT